MAQPLARPSKLASLAVLAVLLAAPAAAQTTDAAPPAIGACIWEMLSEPIRADFLAAYPDQADRRAVNRAMVRLSRYNGAVQVAGRGCTDVNPPVLWAASAVSAHAVRLGAASVLDRQAGVSRSQLDAVWTGASGSARACLRASAGKRFGLKMPLCAEPAFAKGLLQPLNLSRPEDRAQALRFLLATAEGQIADALIARREPPPTGPK